MSKIKLTDYIAKRLKEFHNVEHFFMVSGGGAMHLNDSLGRYIPYTANHHEQACAIAAEGYARVNQKLAVVNVTTGPGGLNCLNGVFGQWTDSVPVLYISGQVKYSTTMASCPEIQLRQLGDQEVDIISVVKPLVKYAKMLTEPNEIKYHLDKAVYEATTGRMGPVWLDIPMNVQGALIDENDLIDFVLPKQPVYDLKVDEVVEKLKFAKRPLIVAGHGIRLANKISAFEQIVNKSHIPVVCTFNGCDILSTKNEFNMGKIGTIGQRAGNFVLQNADVILFLGTRNNIRQASYNWENFAKNAYKIVVDIDKAELEKPLVKPDVSVNADLNEFIDKLSNQLNGYVSNEKWVKFCQNLKDKYSFENRPEHIQQENIINPYFFTKILMSKLGENDTLVSANATPSICIFQIGDFNGQRVIMNSGDASMGYGLPAAIGAYYQTKGKIIAFEGDGSIMMNIQELQTVAYNKLPLKIFVINNSGYSSIRQTQRNFFNGHMTGSGADSGVSVPDFIEVGKAFGIKSIKIENPREMEHQIENALLEKGPVLCEVITEKEYTFAPKLSAKKLPDGTMVSPSLEDMFPFLDREEYESNIAF